jgi:plasmid stabilization system protein ParE
MSGKQASSESTAGPQPTTALTDRVQRRIERATLALEQKGDQPKTQEVRALRDVMRQLGDVHTQYRKRTGKRVSPPLRAAVDAFKQEPSLSSLLPVAAIVDDLKLLTW